MKNKMTTAAIILQTLSSLQSVAAPEPIPHHGIGNTDALTNTEVGLIGLGAALTLVGVVAGSIYCYFRCRNRRNNQNQLADQPMENQQAYLVMDNQRIP
jgi:hypothetical protein